VIDMARKTGQSERAAFAPGSSNEFSLDFKIPDDVVDAIQTAFGFVLTAAEVARIEAMAGEAIGYRRSFPEGSAIEKDYRDQLRETKKRREQIVNALSQVWVDGQSLRSYRHAPNTGPRKSRAIRARAGSGHEPRGEAGDLA
jgi:hypothetical protein